LYYLLPFKWRTGLLALCSYVFYGWANPWWAVLMFLSSMVDYLCGRVLVWQSGLPTPADGELPLIPREMPRTRGMKITLAVSMISNLLLLAYFKYIGFTIENVRQLVAMLGMQESAIPAFRVILPVGISFYTFQSMSYAIDVYRGDARPMRRITDFACFEALFPQLVAGPIVRYSDVADQMRHRTHSTEKFARGIAFFAIGMAKKILIANPMGHVADRAFAAAGLHWYDAWYGLVSYAFQIYFDFSGYSDMAVGLGLMMGFLFIQNFNQPYRADSITDFWRRWHISLSTWLRDYLYIPLGGNRLSHSRTYINLMLVMLIGGLWHGASWNFVIWGGIHGTVLAIERFQGKDSLYRALPRAFRVAVTFLIVCLGWVFFRADTLPQAMTYLGSLFGLAHIPDGYGGVQVSMYTPLHVLIFLAAVLIVWKGPESWVFTKRLHLRRAVTIMGILAVAVIMMWSQAENYFIYFRF
ncbi:MAG TPA: MBOAT family O-acyltransferase, partial [Tepidisphaeraceae bacterium]|nr:MBOAT family O-acyltransferase [Tepidisphaeraceae bacterium]